MAKDLGARIRAIPVGLAYAAMAAFLFSLMSLLVKLASQRLPTTEIVLARSIVGTIMGYWMLRAARVPIWGNRKGLLLFRGLAGFGALMSFFYVLGRLPLAEATVLFYTAPVFTAVTAAIFLGERMGPLEILGFAFCLVGVVLVAQPEFFFGGASQGHSLFAIAVGLLGAMSGGAAFAAVRELRKTEHHLVVVFYFPVISLLLCVPLMAGNVVVPTATGWLLLIGIGVVMQIAQIFLTKALNLEKTTRAMSVSYLQILFAAQWGILFLGELPNVLSIAGAVLVIAGTVVVTRHSSPSPEQKAEESPSYLSKAARV